jgi:predicted AlkP superfamily pyrophosphatase or phosphodiesterase
MFDGLRPGMVNEQTTPALAGLMKKGVHFTNTHAMFPTFTTPNAASMATGAQATVPQGECTTNYYGHGSC